jgi:hypothetical protein
MHRQMLPDHDIASLIRHMYSYYTAAQLKMDIELRKKDRTHLWKKYYEGYRTQKVYKDGIPCIYVIYVSRKRWDNSVRQWHNIDGKLRKKIRKEKIANLTRCKKFKERVRKAMLAAGYVEHINYDDSGRLLFYLLPTRFYRDMYRYRNGFKEMEVLARLDKNKDGLRGTYMVHRIVQARGHTKYLLRPLDFGSIPRDSQALSLRELMLYGYYPIGMSSMQHLKNLTTYWNDYNRKFFLPPEEGFKIYDRCTWKVYLARRRIKRRMKKK